MSQPILTLFNADNTAEVTEWNIGEIKASTESAPLDLVLWNNRGGAADISDAMETSITNLDEDGGDVSKMTVEKWMRVKVNGAATATPIGGVDGAPIKAIGLLPTDGDILKGTINDGNMDTTASKVNYAKLSLSVKIPLNGQNGLHKFRGRVRFFYT